MGITQSTEAYAIGELTSEEREQGGSWLLGDLLPTDHPGYTTKLLVKIWIGIPEKYDPPGHYTAPKIEPRTLELPHGGRHEFVQVWRGHLKCTYRQHDQEITTLLHFPNSVDLPPGIARRWTRVPSLQPQPDPAGITICRYVPGFANGSGLGYHFTHIRINSDSPVEPEFGTTDFSPSEFDTTSPDIPWQSCLTIVLCGKLRCRGGKEEFTLESPQHLFTNRETSLQFAISQPFSCTRLYY